MYYQSEEEKVYRGFGINAEFAGNFVIGFDNVDDDIGSVWKLSWSSLEANHAGIEDFETLKLGNGDLRSLHKLLHAGGVLDAFQLRFNHPILRLRVAVYDNVVDSDRNQLRRQAPR